MADGKAYVQAGAGIVADSNPTAEYEETKDKAQALWDGAARAGAEPACEPGAAERVASEWFSFIDNYDSFTYNLVQYLGELGARRRSVRRNDQITLDEIAGAGAERTS